MNRVNTWIRKKIDQTKIECEICLSTEDLEFAHITPTSLEGPGRGRKERYYDYIHNMEAYMILCEPCHKKYDAVQKVSMNLKIT